MAIIDTDGRETVEPVAATTVEFPTALSVLLERAVSVARRCTMVDTTIPDVVAAEAAFTEFASLQLSAWLAVLGIGPETLAVVGFHGQTIAHAPERGWTWQIGDGAQLAADLGCSVVGSFRQADMAAGGQGAPLAPLYHAARAHRLHEPLAVLNLGGVGNVTWLEPGWTAETSGFAPPIAFDTGPGNGLLDDWVQHHTGEAFDRDGRWAAAGRVRPDILTALIDTPYFDLPPPKSLDRYDFGLEPLRGLPVQDGAATLAELTVESVRLAALHFPKPVRRWLVCGGGRHNAHLMARLRHRLGQPVAPVEAVGWNGDALEAEAFAYLGVRALDGAVLTVPSTTGVACPTSGGRITHPTGGQGRGARR